MNKARKDDIVVKKLKDETLIYDLKENKAYCLNETSAMVWRLCDGKRSAVEIAEEISRELGVTTKKHFVLVALDQLDKNNLLEDKEKGYLAGLSRREVIRKIGVTSVIALPIVSSIVAPQASAAQSMSASCTVGTCIAAGVNICGICAGRTVEVVVLSTGNGTCGGAQQIQNGDRDCVNFPSLIDGVNDSRIISVT